MLIYGPLSTAPVYTPAYLPNHTTALLSLQYTCTEPSQAVCCVRCLSWFDCVLIFLCFIIGMAGLTELMSVRSRTVILTLSKGPQVVPGDFYQALDVVMGRIVAFGTVGVGHVWHLTLIDSHDVEVVLEQGDFEIKGRDVSVSAFDTSLLTGTLFWLPFWVPHRDVEDSLGKLLADAVTSMYVTIPQPGYRDCFSTQRKIRSVTDMSDLPYFIPITSEGHTYRTFLFVPGRPPVCFKCSQSGHMKNSCTNPDKPKPYTEASLLPETISETKSLDIVKPPAIEAPAVPTHAADAPYPDPMDHTPTPGVFPQLQDYQFRKSPSLATASTYRLEFIVDSKIKIYTHGEDIVTVRPPCITGHKIEAFHKKTAICTEAMCHGISMWEAGKVSYSDMKCHLEEHHPGITQVRC